MPARNIFSCRRFYHFLFCLVLSDSRLSEALKTMLSFLEMIKTKYGLSFTETKPNHIGVELKSTNLFQGGRNATYKWHIRVAQTMLEDPKPLKFLQYQVLRDSDASHQDEKYIATSRTTDMLLLLCIAQDYLTSPVRPK